MLKLKMISGIVVVVGCSSFMSGCATGVYTPPGTLSKDESKYEVTVNKSYDATWSALTDYASSTFFAIDNFEKASGLMTLSFGSSDPTRFIDCGAMDVKVGAVKFNGPYVEYMSKNFGAKLSGKMNLFVRQVEPNKIVVRANARYVFDAPAKEYYPGNTWVFESGGESTIKVSGATQGTIPTRTCRPTYVAEKAILDAVSK